MKKLVPIGAAGSVIMALLASGAAVAACSDSKDDGGTATPGDTSGKKIDTPADPNCPATDAGGGPKADAGNPDKPDAGNGMSYNVETTGLVQIQDSYLVGAFFEDDVVIRDEKAPDCVMYVRSGSKPASKGGTMTVTGTFFGQPGGPPLNPPMTLNASAEYHVYETYLNYPPVFYPHDQSFDVSVKASGFPGVPPLPLTTLKSPAFSNVAITKPEVPDGGGTLFVDSKKSFDVAWSLPDGGGAGAKMIFALWNVSIVFDGFTKVGEVRCEAPMSAGKMTVPSSLLREAKVRAEPNNPVPGIIMRIFAGDRKEVRVANPNTGGEGASYSVELSSEVGTSWGEYYDVTLN